MLFIALIRGINVGGHKILPMAKLKSICESLGCTNVRTLLNSGNVLFEAKKADAKRLEEAIDAKVILRSPAELGEAIANNPFATEATDDPGHLLVMFLDRAPSSGVAWPGPEKTHLSGSHLYLYYPNGAGRSKLTGAWIEKQLKVVGTARNWNTVQKLSALANPRPGSR